MNDGAQLRRFQRLLEKTREKRGKEPARGTETADMPAEMHRKPVTDN